MPKENLDDKEVRNNEKLEKSPENFLRKSLNNLSDRTALENDRLKEVEEKIQESDPGLQEEIRNSGAINQLREKMRKNKLVRAGLVGLSLFSANPVLASELNKVLNKNTPTESIPLSQEKEILNLDQIQNLPEFRKEEMQNILSSSSERVRDIILDELENGNGTEKPMETSGDLLVLQQQVLDLQNSGEMDLRRKGGVVLPFDENHSGKNDGIEYTDDSLAENGGRQKITLENANEEQIRNWVNFVKDPEKYKQRKAEWNEKNKQGWQSSDYKGEDSNLSQEKDEKNSTNTIFEKESDGH